MDWNIFNWEWKTGKLLMGLAIAHFVVGIIAAMAGVVEVFLYGMAGFTTHLTAFSSWKLEDLKRRDMAANLEAAQSEIARLQAELEHKGGARS